MHKGKTRNWVRGQEKNPGGLQLPGPAKQGWVGMDLKRPKAKSERWKFWMFLETAEFFYSYRKGQNKICARQPLIMYYRKLQNTLGKVVVQGSRRWFSGVLAGYNFRSSYVCISCCKNLSEIDPFITFSWLLRWLLFILEKWRGCKNSNVPWKPLGTACVCPRENIWPLDPFSICWSH